MKKLLTTIALTALMAGAVRNASATEGWYARADVGHSVAGEITTFGDDYDLEDDWMADVAGGYAFRNGFRTDAEIAWRNNEVELFNDDVEVWSAMANLFYDFNRGGRFQPYIGAGVGYAELEYNNLDDADWAWQAMAGVGVALSEQATLDIGYRHFAIEGLSLPLDGDTDVEYWHQAVTLGLRYQFAAPAAPPPQAPLPVVQQQTPPPPPVCPTSEFTLYFEWDRSNLNAGALETIDAAVTRARQCNVGAVAIVGHTDTSGAAAYNIGLSQRRASVVNEALVARGIPAAIITADARGETDLAQATGDGVREPLNRRTAVTIRFR